MNSFNITSRTLMGPGPSNVYPKVLNALSKPTIGHLDPQFITMMNEIKVMLRYAFQTKNELTMPVSAPGSAGMETCFANLVEPGDQVLVCINGVFGHRMKENVERFGGECLVVEDNWGAPVDPHKVEKMLSANPKVKILAFVHAETSTGALSDAEALCQIALQYDCLTIVDAVTSLAGSPLKVDAWEIDAIYSGTQKCLSCVPGLSPVSFNKKAIAVIQNRKTKVPSWFLDLNLVMSYWGSTGSSAPRAYHHTAPVNSLYALHESLILLQEEGLENSWTRHTKNHELLRDKLEEIGIEYLVKKECRLPQLNSVIIPESYNDKEIRKRALNDFNLEIGGGLGALTGKVWRIGLMGYTSNKENVNKCVAILKEIMQK